MRREMCSLLFVAVGGLLAGCGDFVNNFQCQQSDFEKVTRAVSTHFGTQESIHRRDAGSYQIASELNAKLAKTCPVEVLEKCSPGNTRVVGTGDSIIGPINSFGVRASVSLRSVYRHDGFARTKELEAEYSTSVTRSEFRKTVACYEAEIN